MSRIDRFFLRFDRLSDDGQLYWLLGAVAVLWTLLVIGSRWILGVLA